MKILKQNLLKTIIGAGLATIPLASRAQAIQKMDDSSERVVSIGASYALDTPRGMQNYGATIKYGFIEEVFDESGKFRGMANIDLYGAISNTQVKNQHSQSYGLGGTLKFGAGWNKVLLTASKGYCVVINSDKTYSFMDKYGVGAMWQTGNYTRLYCDFIFWGQHLASSGEISLPYKKSIEIGIIHTLHRSQNSR